ncbi:MAG: BlaI/MecI/CopY family transcriptional regulator [Candidatus Eisenbacteria bacterium]
MYEELRRQSSRCLEEETMARIPPLPTESELQILGVLWDQGPSTVRQVLEAMPKAKTVGYTTVLKTLQIMASKGLVRRDESERTLCLPGRAPAEEHGATSRAGPAGQGIWDPRPACSNRLFRVAP